MLQLTPPSTTAVESSVTVLPSASWIPPAPANAVFESDYSVAAPEATPPTNPQASSPAYFAPGASVVLQGLANQPDFNGLCGIVSAFDAVCGRYNVLIEIGPNARKQMVKVKSSNL